MEALPTLKQLRHLAALAEHGHFGKAAAACHVTQSTLSASIQELENTLQAVLVDRTRHSVVFTPTGEATVGRALQVIEEATALARAARSQGKPLAGVLRLGVIPTLGPFLLPRLLGKLRRKYPALRLYLREDLTGRLIERLDSGEVDLVLLALPYGTGNVETEVLFEDPFSFCCSRSHPLARSSRISLDEIKEEHLLLLQDGHCLRQHALSACSVRGRPDVDPFEPTSLHTLVQMVDNGLGVTLLPQLAIDAGIAKGLALAIVPFAGKAPARSIGLAWRRGTARRDEFQLFGRELRALAGHA
jgi:LysR family hydrogen peroxide-inducible transcriptional activator